MLDSINVLIATLPHTTDPDAPLSYSVKNIEQCNEISRSLSKQYANRVKLVDLDSIITGKFNKEFVDLGHVTDEGRRIKSKYIGAVIKDVFELPESLNKAHNKWKNIYQTDAIQYYVDVPK